jgi:cation diffusion facilitator family transporter
MSLSPEMPVRPEPDAARNAATERRAAFVALSVALLLMAIKFGAYVLTGSSAVFSDAVESVVNVLAGAFALFAVNYAHRPADQSHPYGHGKVEFFSAGLEGAMIMMAACMIILRAVRDLYFGPAIQRIDLGVLLIALAMVVNGCVGWYLVRKGRASGSLALEADGQHLLSDAVTSVVVLVALLAVRQTGWASIDPIAALLMGVYIGWVGIRLIRRSAAGLMDEQDPDDEKLLRQIIDTHIGPAGQEPRVCSYHKLRHRHTGRYHWIDFHLVVPADWDISRAHEAASFIEHQIETRLKHADATAHVEPCVSESCGRCHDRSLSGHV